MVNRIASWTCALIAAAATAAPAQAAPTEEYVAMGDSAASGNGTRRADLSLSCYRSSRAYGPMIAAARPDTALKFPACQGAETPDIPTQARSLSTATRWVTVSIGGNDIGFGDLIVNCTGHWDEATCLSTVNTVNARIRDELGPKLDRAYATIKSSAPNATVMTIGYPRFFGPTLTCPDADGTTPTEATALNGVADNLDAKIADRSRAAGFTHISVIGTFTGHDVCASVPYINGKSEFNAADTYHPSPEGHRYGFMPLIRKIMG